MPAKSGYRHAKIIFTIGPASESEEVLEQLIIAGVDVCRINMAHASHEWIRTTVDRVRMVSDKVQRQVAILMDVKGPEIRTGDMEGERFLEKGEFFDITTDPITATAGQPAEKITAIGTNYPYLVEQAEIGNTLLIDNGLVSLVVREKDEKRLRCEVVIPGKLTSRRHINVPGVKINLPALTRKDKADIKLGVEVGVDIFALSFVREATDLDILRRYLSGLGSRAGIVAKIEDQSAISNLDEIIEACDGLMVARGDLGIEMPYEQLPIIQRRAVESCLKKGKAVIIATHLLESMIDSPVPTRAEITDISNAVVERADCVMLSAETATGKYPVKCVEVFNRVITHIEANSISGRNESLVLKTPKAKMLRSAAVLAQELGGTGIVVFTRSGFLAQVLSSLRPAWCPVFAFTDIPSTFKKMLMLWGIEPFLMDFSEDPEVTISDAFDYLLRRDWVKVGDHLVFITNVLAGERIIDSIQIRDVEKKPA